MIWSYTCAHHPRPFLSKEALGQSLVAAEAAALPETDTAVMESGRVTALLRQAEGK